MPTMQWRKDLTDTFHGLVSARRRVDAQMKPISGSSPSSPAVNSSDSNGNKKSHPILRPTKKSPFMANCKVVVCDSTHSLPIQACFKLYLEPMTLSPTFLDSNTRFNL